jgi:acyl transferase domain-containing protein
MHPAGMLAQDGRCKTLDAAADGYVRAEAAGFMMLLPAHVAISAGQTYLAGSCALLAGSAVNQDGRSSSLTAPNGPSQQAVIRAALAAGGLSADAVGLLEMHGTGTPLGEQRCASWALDLNCLPPRLVWSYRLIQSQDMSE